MSTSESDGLFRDALDSLGHGVIVFDRTMHVVFMNSWVHDILDIPESLFSAGRPVEELVRFHAERGGYGASDAVDSIVEARLRRLATFEEIQDELPKLGGGHIQVVGHPVGDEHFVLTYIDTTARHLAEQAMQEANSRFSQLFEKTNEGWWFVEPDGRTLDVNPALGDILGRPRDEVLRSTIFDFMDETGCAIVEEQLRLRAAGRADPYEVEFIRPDGSRVECMCSPAPIFDEQGVHVGSIGLWTDISALKRVNRELVEAEERAQVASRAKSEFLSTMSHELRTPLNAILGFAQLLETNRDEPLTELQAESVHYIVEGGRHLLTLITDILDLSRIESGALEFDIDRVMVGDVVTDCLALIRSLADDMEVALGRSGDPNDHLSVHADRTRVRQAVLNLLSNAVKYNRRGGQVCVDVAPIGDDFVRIAVDDTGVGLAAGDLEAAFEPFKRLGAEKSTIEGAGIGLTFTKQVVEQMGGRVGVESELGRGSRFWIDLPVG